MLTPAVVRGFPEGSNSSKRPLYVILAASALAIIPFLIWPRLAKGLLAANFLPHSYCYLRNPGLVWTHVVADTLIGIAYLAISVTLGYLVRRARRDIPFHWILLAFGLFIIACGITHLTEVVTIWIPVYVLSAAVKVLTAVTSLATAVVLPLMVPAIFTLVQRAKSSEQVTAELRASEERKEALLREVHHRVKNNLAVICSLFYLQSTHTKNEESVRIFRDMENRVHSMALVHEILYGSENLARINFAEYAQALANDILSSHANPGVPVRLKSELEPVIMGVDLAVSCGLILNELISNAFKHGFPNRAGGEIRVTLSSGPNGRCTLCVDDNGVGIPAYLDVDAGRSLGLRLVRSLTKQIRGAFELIKIDPGTSARLQFTVD
ncbi:MAG: sensor histidine kinase [Candidatus Sulfotelmatobacter sp.]